MAIRRFFVSLIAHKGQAELVATPTLLQARREAIRLASVLPVEAEHREACFVGIMRVDSPKSQTPMCVFVHLASGVGEWDDVDAFLTSLEPNRLHKKRAIDLDPDVMREISTVLSGKRFAPRGQQRTRAQDRNRSRRQQAMARIAEMQTEQGLRPDEMPKLPRQRKPKKKNRKRNR